MAASLPGLPRGEAWYWSPAIGDVFERFAVRRRRTFDSSASPKPGQAARLPRVLAPVDKARLGEQLAAVAAEAAANKPDRLRARIAELERQLAASAKPAAPDRAAIEAAVREALAQRGTHYERVLTDLRDNLNGLPEVLREAAGDIALALDAAERSRRSVADGAKTEPRTFQTQEPNGGGRARVRPDGAAAAPAERIGSGERRMLDVLVSRSPMRLTEAQWATLAGMKRSGGTWGTYKSRLRVAGMIEQDGQYFRASDKAMDLFGGSAAPPGDAIGEWKRKLGSGPARMIDALLEHGPLERERLAEVCGLTANAGTFGTYLSRLRSNGLVRDCEGRIVLVEWLGR